MGTIQALLHNYVLVVAVSGWLIAQLIKTITVLITTHRFDVERLTGAGGMPSAHSAAVCGMAIAVAKTVGVGDPLFALAFLFASVVMYDATGVRRAAGEQAKVLNKIVEMTSDNIREMFAPKKKRDIKNLFIRRKNMEVDPEELRKMEEDSQTAMSRLTGGLGGLGGGFPF